jgi:diguanylate cyclase (GGDEF)-like protein/PAS domain S-box-containing protein
MENRKIKIVAVDDNRDNLDTLRALILDALPQALVLTALNSPLGFELAVTEKPDVIFLDTIMAVQDDFEVCMKLKANKTLCDIPVVFITDEKVDKDCRSKVLECGADGFLSKPIDASELATLIRAMLKIRATKKEQTLIEAIFDSIPGYLYVYDENGKLIKWNKKHETMTGYTAEELSLMTLEKWFDQEEIIRVNAAVQDVFEKGYGEVEAQLSLKSGEKMMTRSNGVPLILDGHKYFTGIGIDVTEQKRLEEQLHQNMNDLLESQRIAHLGTWRLDLATNHVVWSEELYKMYGFDPTIPPPPYTEHMQLFTPESWAKLSTSLERTRTTGIPYELELETVTKDGTNGWMWVRGEAEKDVNGNIISLHGAAQDITARKKIEYAIKESEERFQLLFNKAPLGYQSLDFEGHFIEVNQKWIDTLGYSKEEVIGKWFGDFLCPEYVEGFRQRFPIFKAQGHIHSEFEMLSKDGKRLYIAFEGKVGNDGEGKFKQTHCILQDITDQRKAEQALIESEERYRHLFEYSGVGIGYYTPDGVVVSYNKKALENIGGELADYVGKTIETLFPKEQADIYYERLEKAITCDQPQLYEDYLMLNSEPRWFSTTFTRVLNSVGEVIGVQIASLDITRRKEAETELIHLSYHDHLTGLYNRRFFEEEVKRLDTKQNLPLSIIMCDVNGLKLVNDSFGHDSGDTLLKRAAEAIKKACREGDVIARVGGDEFVVLLPGTSALESVQVANKIKEMALKEAVFNIELSISYGYDTKTTNTQSMIEIIANAENHMYRHKLYERASLRSNTVDLIMNTLFEKSNREALHSSRVSSICESIASKLDLDKDIVNQMRIAGLIHDIGKIGVSESILNKPGSLSIEERSDIERHPETGWRILSSTDELSDLAEYILNHHEKWDGSGYPNRLKGEAIQLEARIIAVADAYDAMTSERSYRKAMSKKEAIKELARCSGTQFDPRIIDVFVNQVLPENSDFASLEWRKKTRLLLR